MEARTQEAEQEGLAVPQGGDYQDRSRCTSGVGSAAIGGVGAAAGAAPGAAGAAPGGVAGVAARGGGEGEEGGPGMNGLHVLGMVFQTKQDASQLANYLVRSFSMSSRSSSQCCHPCIR